MESKLASNARKFKVLIVLAIAATLSLGVYMYQGNEVSLNMDGMTINTVSYAKTVGEFLQNEEISLKKGAYINVPLDTKLEKDINITIINPKPYTIDVNGSLLEVTSIHSTVREVLNDLNIVLDEKDYTYPELSAKLQPSSTIQVFHVEEVVEIEDTIIPFEEQVINTNRLEAGKVNLVQEGKDGLRRSHIKKEYINGTLNSTIIVKDEIVSEPVTRVVERGTRDYIVTSRGNTRYKKSIVMTATAYDLSFASTGKRPGDKYYGITASGTKARPGVVAVDPKVIPLGTKLYVQSLDGTKDYGFAIAEDKGGAIKGNKIDLFFETATQVKNFGRRKVKVYILKD